MPRGCGGCGGRVVRRTVVVRTVPRSWKFDVVARDSWSGAVSTVSVVHSALERTKFRHLNRPQWKVMTHEVLRSVVVVCKGWLGG